MAPLMVHCLAYARAVSNRSGDVDTSIVHKMFRERGESKGDYQELSSNILPSSSIVRVITDFRHAPVDVSRASASANGRTVGTHHT
jgi:hypothetical protein